MKNQDAGFETSEIFDALMAAYDNQDWLVMYNCTVAFIPILMKLQVAILPPEDLGRLLEITRKYAQLKMIQSVPEDNPQ